MVREGQDALKREHNDCASLAPMGRWLVSQVEGMWEDRKWVGEGLDEGGWEFKSHVRDVSVGKADEVTERGGENQLPQK